MAVMEWAAAEHPVADALTAMGAALDGVVDASLWSLPDGQVEQLLAEACRLEGRLSEVTTRLVGEIGSAGVGAAGRGGVDEGVAASAAAADSGRG